MPARISTAAMSSGARSASPNSVMASTRLTTRCTNCKGIWFDLGEADELKGKWMSEFVDVGTAQRIIGLQVDVIVDYHDIANFKIGIHSPAGIRYHQRVCTE